MKKQPKNDDFESFFPVFISKNAENKKTHITSEGGAGPPLRTLSFGDVFFHGTEKATTI